MSVPCRAIIMIITLIAACFDWPTFRTVTVPCAVHIQSFSTLRNTEVADPSTLIALAVILHACCDWFNGFSNSYTATLP